ncbi:MAG TPA: hypothetical protein DCL77_07670 [Prolixibacteraceae bacterium]|jgi:hypothetical protein|nr:hypothetical protein [Prolixibacteraceae bacterium]
MKYSINELVKRTFLVFIGILFTMMSYSATYYVSNSGSDSNNGQSENNSWQTLARVNSASLAAGDSVLFHSGDSWFGQLVPKSGSSSARITYGAYGTGNKPLIHAAITKMSTGDWVDQGSNIWRSSSTYSTEIGNILFNGSVCGMRKYSDGALTAQGHFYYNTSTDYITLYSKGNPASYYSDIKLLSVAILVKINDKSNINVKDLNLSFTGGYSVVGDGVSGITLSNLTMIWIGGQTYSGEVRKGNAVEFWNNCQNALVEKCTVGEVFDAGLSNQGDNATQKNITYRKNIIYHCEYSYEYFLPEGETSNILFENNTCVDAGLGWGHSQRPNPSGRHIRIAGTPSNTNNFVVRNNIFCNAVDVLNYTRSIEGLEDRFTFNYNAFYQTLSSNLAQIKMVYYPTFSAYQSATGWESNSSNKDPLFVDAANHDYRLASNSPCIDAGDPSSAKDANGTRSDMGALESGSSAANTSDTSRPVVSAFDIPSTSTSLTVPLSTLSATDNVGVTAFLINESSVTPALSSTMWHPTAPTTYQALSPGTKTLYAWARDAAGNISYARTENVTITDGGVTTGTENIIEPLKIDVYPNPCRDQVTVRFSQTPEAGSHVEIFDVTGKSVASREITNAEEQFTLTAQSAGLYMVKTKVGSTEKVTKLIINK